MRQKSYKNPAKDRRYSPENVLQESEEPTDEELEEEQETRNRGLTRR
jgi:hypothetical protein